jgi:hypothetical protein
MIITPQFARGLAIARAAESMLRTLGGVEVSVRFSSPTTPAFCEFGLAASSTTDVQLSPVLVRNANTATPKTVSRFSRGTNAPMNDLEFVFAAGAVEKAAQLDGYPPIDWFARSLGIFFSDALHPIISVATENFAGQPYLYRVTTK